MSWRGQGGYAALVLLLGLTGCALDSLDTRVEQIAPIGDEAVIAGSADAVAVRASAMLQGLGITAEVVHEGAAMHLTCDTPSGKRFALTFKERQTPAGTETAVKLKWENGADDAQAVNILARLGTLNVR